MTNFGSDESAGAVAVLRRAVDVLVRVRITLRPPARAIGFALVVLALGFGVRWLMPEPGPRFIVLYPSVVLASLFGGALSGLVATLLGALAATLFIFEPLGSFAVARTLDLVSILNFTLTGLLTSAVAALDGAISSRFLRGELELIGAERRYRSMIDVLHEGVILFSGDGRVIAANPSAERILGFAPGALVADEAAFGSWSLLAEDGTPLPPCDYPAVRALTDRRPITDLVVGVPVGERVVWLLNNANPMIDTETGTIEGVVVSFIEVTEQRRLVDESRKSRAELQSVFDALQEGVMVFDPSGGR